MYAGCWNFKTLKVSVAILNSIREEIGSHEACEALAKYDQIALLMDILC